MAEIFSHLKIYCWFLFIRKCATTSTGIHFRSIYFVRNKVFKNKFRINCAHRKFYCIILYLLNKQKNLDNFLVFQNLQKCLPSPVPRRLRKVSMQLIDQLFFWSYFTFTFKISESIPTLPYIKINKTLRIG